jgi:hypothetical protein
MPVKPRLNESAQEKANERLDKQLARVYLIWLVGLFVGALHLKPEKVEYGGLSFTIDSSEKLQGIIFFVCLLYYIGILGLVVFYQLQFVTTNRGIKRRIIYGALGARRTLIGLDKRRLYMMRMSARIAFVLAVIFLGIVTFFPAIHILWASRKIAPLPEFVRV